MTQAGSFPIQWDSPEDVQLFWTRDEVHFPYPTTPLNATLLCAITSSGMTEAARELGIPLRSRSKVVNGYVYNSMGPAGFPPDPQRARQAAFDARRRWDEELLPELLRDIAYLKSKDLAALSNAELLAHLDEALTIERRHWVIHFLAVMPLFGSSGAFSGMYNQIFGDRATEDAPYRLVLGFDNKTLEGNRALRALAETARALPEVAALIRNRAPELPRAELAAATGGVAFLEQFDAFLDEWGYRATAHDDISDPTWREDPSFVVSTVRDYLERPPVDLEAQLRDQAAQREQLVAETLAAIEDPAQRAQFEGALRLTQANWPIRENHSFYIDQMSVALIRRIIVEMGNRLTAAGRVADPSDVFYLKFDELLAAQADGASGDLRPLTDERRRERQAQRELQPPPFLGTPPPAGAPGPDPEIAKFFGRPPSKPPTATTITGFAASRGTATGPARLIRHTGEFGRVQPGDILICQTTTPPWTPLFSVISGLVTDSGGVLSHGAIVAREYGLPAVVGARGASSLIRDGQVVTVDGVAGVVTLHE